MKDHELQDDLEIVEDEEEIDFYCDSPYYYDPAYPEFYGWRDLLL